MNNQDLLTDDRIFRATIKGLSEFKLVNELLQLEDFVKEKKPESLTKFYHAVIMA